MNEYPAIDCALPAAEARSKSVVPAAHALEQPRRVLFVSYTFPPVGGAGVQRVVKFVKYLQDFDWHASVLTVANPSVPLYDASLLEDVPEQTIIRKARTWEPSYAFKSRLSAGSDSAARRSGGIRSSVKTFGRRLVNMLLQPDPQALWMPGAIREGSRLLREVPHAAIVATGPPFSTFLTGAILSKRSGLPLVLDYRDEWDLSNSYLENKVLGPFARWVQERLQRRAVCSASALVATTRASARALETIRARVATQARVTWIYNGFDPADFPPTMGPAPSKIFRLVYVGTLWNLTAVAPLVDGVRRLAERSPELAAQLELVFAGRRTASQQQVLDQLKALPCKLVEHPYLDHREALDLIRTADGLCLLLSDLPGAERVVPAKLFEYLAAQRPILAIAPPGECWDLLRDHPAAQLREPGDGAGIAEALIEALHRHRLGGPQRGTNWDTARYDRRTQAGQLARLLGALTATGD